MAKSLEYEQRVMLSITQYKKLKKEFDSLRPFTLINEYFDTSNLDIIKSRRMLRIRNLNHKGYELTLKIKGSNGDVEINENISNYKRCRIKNDSIFPKGEIKKILENEYNLKDIVFITKLKTIRIEKQIGDYLLVLDKNLYNGIVDYDLEVESVSKERATEVIKKYCTVYNIEFNENYRGKSRRAIMSIRSDL